MPNDEGKNMEIENQPGGTVAAPMSPAAAGVSAAELNEVDKKKVREALHLLEEVAVDKRDALKLLIAEKYSNLKTVVKETESGVTAKLNSAKCRATEAAVHAKEVAVHAKDVGAEKAVEVAKQVDKSVHDKPWQFIGGVALSSLLLGWILGRRD